MGEQDWVVAQNQRAGLWWLGRAREQDWWFHRTPIRRFRTVVTVVAAQGQRAGLWWLRRANKELRTDALEGDAGFCAAPGFHLGAAFRSFPGAGLGWSSSRATQASAPSSTH